MKLASNLTSLGILLICLPLFLICAALIVALVLYSPVLSFAAVGILGGLIGRAIERRKQRRDS